MFKQIITVAFLATIVSAGTIDRRDRFGGGISNGPGNPFSLQVTTPKLGNEGGVQTGDRDFDRGDPQSLSAEACGGTVTARQLTQNEMSCVYQLPATLPAGVTKFTDPVNAFEISFPQGCAGYSITVDNSCGDCGGVGELINAGVCGSNGKNILPICNNNGVLAAC
ncbi:hypothetical protein VTL71DRAFT_8910 [Oculimacula yallundae]|uniref:Uncharacterized protein n=1 Tax=Oculimacula yallundae TaxID=86028 RepID=A0ABR4BTC5_9HELO